MQNNKSQISTYFGIVWKLENNYSKVIIWSVDLGDVSICLEKSHSIRLGDWVSFQQNTKYGHGLMYQNVKQAIMPDGITVLFQSDQVVILCSGLIGSCADRETGIIWCDYFGKIQCQSSQCTVGLPEPLTAVSFRAIRMPCGFGSPSANIGWKAISFAPMQSEMSGFEKSLSLVDDVVVVKLVHCDQCILSTDKLSTKLYASVKSDFWFFKDEETDQESILETLKRGTALWAIVSRIPLSGQAYGNKFDVMFCAPEKAMIISMRNRPFGKVSKPPSYIERSYRMAEKSEPTKPTLSVSFQKKLVQQIRNEDESSDDDFTGVAAVEEMDKIFGPSSIQPNKTHQLKDEMNTKSQEIQIRKDEEDESSDGEMFACGVAVEENEKYGASSQIVQPNTAPQLKVEMNAKSQLPSTNNQPQSSDSNCASRGSSIRSLNGSPSEASNAGSVEVPQVKVEVPQVKDEVPQLKDEVPQVKDEMPQVKDEMPQASIEVNNNESARMKADETLVDELLSKHLAEVCQMCPKLAVQCMRVRGKLAPQK